MNTGHPAGWESLTLLPLCSLWALRMSFLFGVPLPFCSRKLKFLALSISESISWHCPIRTRHSRFCLLPPALYHLLPLSKPQKISSHCRINEQALIPQKKSSSLWWPRQKICGRRWKSVPVSKSQGKWGSDKAETHRNKWPVAVKTKGSTAAPLGSSSLGPSAEHRSLLRVEFLSKLWIITYPEEMRDSKLRMLMEWRNRIAKQWQRNTNMAMVGTTHYNLVFLYWAIQFYYPCQTANLKIVQVQSLIMSSIWAVQLKNSFCFVNLELQTSRVLN